MGGNVVDLVFKLFLVVVVSIYWRFDYVRLEQLWLLLFPIDTARPPAVCGVNCNSTWAPRSELLQTLIAAVVFSLGFSWMGLPYPVVAGVLAAAMWLVPWLGPLWH